ncbi:MAG: hypothetical protein KY453_08205 [Gemmatimonadetes bacterium]|nr:hypothetical protein [Gemmatimonadota bacterium]
MLIPSRVLGPLALAGALGATACADDGRPRGRDASDLEVRAAVQAAFDRTVPRIVAAVDAVDGALQPVPLLRPPSGPRFAATSTRTSSRGGRRLGGWVVRGLDHSRPVVTPDPLALLEEIAERFHASLDSLGVPPVRLEVTSALRTVESQADLRRSNSNAAGGQSTHEYGTTLDLAYSGFAGGGARHR